MIAEFGVMCSHIRLLADSESSAFADFPVHVRTVPRHHCRPECPAGDRSGAGEPHRWHGDIRLGACRALAADGTAVSLIVRSPGRLPTETLDGVRLIPEIEPLRAWRWDVSRSVERVSGFPGIRIRSLNNGVWWKAPALAALRIVRKRPGLEQRLAG